MKHLYLLLVIGLIFVSSGFANAQHTLTSSVNPAIGNVQKAVFVDASSLQPGNAGANQTWNFSSLTVEDSTVFTWVSPAGTPYAASFPTANIAVDQGGSAFSYYSVSSTDFMFHGSGTGIGVIAYTDNQKLLRYPFSFNSTFTDNFSATYNVGATTFRRTGSNTTTGDAWGTIILPFGTFNNVIRVKDVLTMKDSANVGGFPIVTNTVETSYSWFAPGLKFSVFNITITTSGSVTETYANYHTDNPVNITNIGTSVPGDFSLSQNYPNPFNPATQIDFDLPSSSDVMLKIYNSMGKEVETLVNEKLAGGKYKVTFNGAGYTSGVYFYRLTVGDRIETRKMLLVK